MQIRAVNASHEDLTVLCVYVLGHFKSIHMIYFDSLVPKCRNIEKIASMLKIADGRHIEIVP